VVRYAFQNLKFFDISASGNSCSLDEEKQAGIFRGGITEMKIKRDFVTNSSSTSFMLTFKTEAGGKDAFIDKFNDLLKDYVKKSDWDEKFKKPPILTSDRVTNKGSDEYVITDFAAIYSNELDMPQHIQDLLDKDSDAGKLLEQAGIKLVATEIKDLNE
jgi:hypothetical protein